MKWTHAWTRAHRNGLLATVNRMELDDETVIYSAGALPRDGVGMLRYGLRDVTTAQQYADAEAKQDGHACDATCGTWPPMM